MRRRRIRRARGLVEIDGRIVTPTRLDDVASEAGARHELCVAVDLDRLAEDEKRDVVTPRPVHRWIFRCPVVDEQPRNTGFLLTCARGGDTCRRALVGAVRR